MSKHKVGLDVANYKVKFNKNGWVLTLIVLVIGFLLLLFFSGVAILLGKICA